VAFVKAPGAERSTVADSWRWIWPDTLMRIIPMGAAPFVYIAIFHLPLSFLGLTLHNATQQIVIGLLVGIPMAAFAVLWRMFIVGSWFRWPTVGDHILQGSFYFLINAPVEELFFRGFMLAAVTQWTGWLGWGWLASTAVYTLYHRLGKWSWRSVGGVGVAGVVFSLVYLLQPYPYSLLGVIIIHGFTTAGFLSWCDEVMYRIWKRRQKPVL
jgi:membrane protease YdiL (CAAX protease family)